MPGRRHAITEEARATLMSRNVANYRQTVLQAFQEVEDNLSGLRILNSESVAQQRAVDSARRSLNISTSRYKGGVTTYLEVITAQTTQLSNERTAADITTREFAASVQLVKALGGGWDTTKLPTPLSQPCALEFGEGSGGEDLLRLSAGYPVDHEFPIAVAAQFKNQVSPIVGLGIHRIHQPHPGASRQGDRHRSQT